MGLVGWFQQRVEVVAARLEAAPALHRSIVAGSKSRPGVHVAVCAEPFLGYVLDGTKTVESRFSRTRVAPFDTVSSGDVVLLKASGGPIVAAAEITEAVFFAPLTEAVQQQLRADFGRELRDDVPGFWEERRSMRYATMLRLGEVVMLDEPLAIPKADRRGWVVLRSRRQQLSLWQ